MENLDAHGKYTQSYVGILDTYKEQISSSVQKKNQLKDRFFSVIKGIMIALVVLFFLILLSSFLIFGMMIICKYQSVAVITGAITAILSSFTTMLVSIFKLPEIIGDYLFNKDEDNQMIEIIKNIQQYEIDAVKLEKTVSIDAEKEIMFREKIDSEMKSSTNTTGMQPTSIESQGTQENCNSNSNEIC